MPTSDQPLTPSGDESRPRSFAARFMRGSDTERLAAFSDAVFAIALTLLVLDIRVPEPTRELTGLPEVNDYLRHQLASSVPQLIGYLISFAIIAGVWSMHFRLFTVLSSYDRTLVRINLVLLLLTSLMPFPTSVFARYAPSPYATGLYALSLTLIFATQLAVWVHAHRAQLLTDRVTAADYKATIRRLSILTIGFALSILAGALMPWATVAMWVIATVSARLAGPKRN